MLSNPKKVIILKIFKKYCIQFFTVVVTNFEENKGELDDKIDLMSVAGRLEPVQLSQQTVKETTKKYKPKFQN